VTELFFPTEMAQEIIDIDKIAKPRQLELHF